MKSIFSGLFRRKSSDWSPIADVFPSSISMSGPEIRRGPTDENAAMSVGAVATCVRLISQTVASLPLRAYRRLPDGGKERVPVTNSLQKVLTRPNAWQTSMQFREQLTGHLLLRGNAYAYINWARVIVDGQPVFQATELLPLNPDTVTVEQDKVSRAVTYTVKRAGGAIRIPAEEMLHLVGFSHDGLRGRSVLEDAREGINVARLTQHYAASFWSNDATPGVVLKHPGKLSKEAAQRLRDSWDEDHAGADNIRRSAVLEEGMSIERLTLTAEDAQFLETRKFQRAEIAGLFMVPPHMIGDVDRSTSWGSGIEQQQIGFLSYTLRPWLVRWEQEIARSLINLDDTYFVEHQVEGLLRGDAAARAAFYDKMVTLGIYTRNEIRELENRNPLPGLDDPLQPLNMVPIGADSPSAGGAA